MHELLTPTTAGDARWSPRGDELEMTEGEMTSSRMSPNMMLGLDLNGDGRIDLELANSPSRAYKVRDDLQAADYRWQMRRASANGKKPRVVPPDAIHHSMGSLESGSDDDHFDTLYSSKKVLIALESLAPKDASHIWVVRQDNDVLDVTTPGSFDDFMRTFCDLFNRDHVKSNGHAPRNNGGTAEETHTWVDFQGLSHDELRELGEILVLHELTIEDLISNDCPEKLEIFEDLDYQYSMLTGEWPDPTRSSGWREVGLSCITFKDWFITIHKQPLVGLDEMLRRVRKDFCASPSDSMNRPPDDRKMSMMWSKTPQVKKPRKMRGLWLYYCMFDVLVDAMIPRVALILDKANEVDELILQLWGSKEPEMDDTTRIMAKTRKHINDIRRSVVAKEAIIKEHRLYKLPQYRDVMDHVMQMIDRLDSARDILAQANSNYLAGVSVQAAIGANSTNEAMKKMSMLAFVFVPMTLVTSMFGMNVQVPWQNVKNTLPFYMILVSFAALALAAVFVFRWKLQKPQKKIPKVKFSDL